MDACEVEFLAEKEMVTVIPNFSLDKVYLIGVSFTGWDGMGRGKTGATDSVGAIESKTIIMEAPP